MPPSAPARRTHRDTLAVDSDARDRSRTPPAVAADQSAPRPRKPATGRKTSKPRRTSRQEYLDRARAAHRPGIVVTPAWVREVVPDISRGTSQVVSDLLNTELTTPHITTSPVADTTRHRPRADTSATSPVAQGRAA